MSSATETLPPLCGDIDIRIDADGTWFHDGAPIGRPELVKLFASVLVRDDAGDFWLQTPAERARIRVLDAPFIGVAIDAEGRGPDQVLHLHTNVGDRVTVDADHPLFVLADPATDTPKPYVTVRAGLDAKLTRSVYYELVDLGAEADVGDTPTFGVWSAGCFFPLDMRDETPC